MGSLTLRFAEDDLTLRDSKGGKEKLFDLSWNGAGETDLSARESKRLEMVSSGGRGALPGERNLGRDLIASEADVNITMVPRSR